VVDDILGNVAWSSDAGVTLNELIEAKGLVATPKRKELMRCKLRPLVLAGKIVAGTAPRKSLAGHMQPVTVYRLVS
jgi:hypothetical protein